MNLINECTAWVVKTAGGITKSCLRVIASIDPDTFNDLFSTNFKGTVIPSNANDKKSHTFTDGTRQFLIRAEKVTKILYNFDETDFDNNIFLTITSGGHLKEQFLFLEGRTIYFKSEKTADIEVSEWY